MWHAVSREFICGLSSSMYLCSVEKKRMLAQIDILIYPLSAVSQSTLTETTEDKVSYKHQTRRSCLKVSYRKTLENVLKGALDRCHFVYLEIIYIIHSLQ